MVNSRQRLFIKAFKQRVKQAFVDVFDTPVGRPAKKAVITVVGVMLTLLGLALIILPGPAFLLLPIGLGVLSLEYPIARQWLRKCQRWMSMGAKKADDFFAKSKSKSNYQSQSQSQSQSKARY
jgi:hypothetical protein